ncbi:cytochrome P450 [Coniochaeta sp. 2T2.1]|nr:cytochrome P450 [Coniochaeta sp. 2T2.1]
MENLARHAYRVWQQHDAFTLAATGAAIGVASHLLYWMHGLRTPQAAAIFWSHLATFTLILTLSILSSHGALLPGLALCASYLAGVFTSMTVYRLFFHPLRKFPGPVTARVSLLHGLFRDKYKSHERLARWCDEYGSDIVRIGPMDLVIRSADAVHKTQTLCGKRGTGTFESFAYEGTWFSLEALMDNDEHRRRRQVWDRAQNGKAMAKYEIDTRTVSRTWLERLSSLDGAPVEITNAMLLVAFDNMGKIGFSKEFGTVTTGQGVKWLALLSSFLRQGAGLAMVTWPLLIIDSVGEFGEVAEFSRISAEMHEDRFQRDEPSLEDFYRYFLEDFRSEKPTSFFDKRDLHADTDALLIAATDTVSVTLAWIFYYLTKHPEIRAKLYEEITPAYGKTIPGEFKDADLSKLEYLGAVINEALRIRPVAGLNTPRVTPPEGIEIDGVWIPGEVQVWTPPWLLGRYEKYFPHADEFIPERWTTRPELVVDRRAFIPFNAGMCFGCSRRLLSGRYLS